MNIHTAFPSKYLKAADLGQAQPVVTISHIDLETMPGDKKEIRPIAYFEGKSKGLVLNRTNANAIAAIAGTEETDNWPGTRVQLYVAEVQFKSEMVEAIRVRAPKGRAMAKPVPPPVTDEDTADDDPIPF